MLVADPLVEPVRPLASHMRPHVHHLAPPVPCPALSLFHEQPAQPTTPLLRKHHDAAKFRVPFHLQQLADENVYPAGHRPASPFGHQERMVFVTLDRLQPSAYLFRGRPIAQLRAQHSQPLSILGDDRPQDHHLVAITLAPQPYLPGQTCPASRHPLAIAASELGSK
jgi:hypothetical protein